MKLYSKVTGEGESLIIMHGVFGSGDNWTSLGRKWSDLYEVHLLDMRNHGKSPHSDEFSYEVMADDLLQYMDENGIEKAFILGHSMGGKVAMLFSALYPDRVLKLIVADIAPKPYEPHHDKIISALQSLDLPSIGSRQEAEDEFAKLLPDEGTRMFLLKSLYWKEKGSLDWRFNLPVIAREVRRVNDALPSNALFYGSTLFIRGGNSWYIQDDDKDQIYDHFPSAEIKTIEDAGHWLHAEKPMQFYQMVNGFLED